MRNSIGELDRHGLVNGLQADADGVQDGRNDSSWSKWWRVYCWATDGRLSKKRKRGVGVMKWFKQQLIGKCCYSVRRLIVLINDGWNNESVKMIKGRVSGKGPL